MNTEKRKNFPNLLPVGPISKIKIGDLKLDTWYAFSNSQGYCDGYLYKRNDNDHLMLIPYWDKGYAYDETSNQLIDTGHQQISLKEVADDDYECFIIHRDLFMYVDFLIDREWEDCPIDYLTDGYLDFYHEQFVYNDFPESRHYIMQKVRSDDFTAFISSEEIKDLYSRDYDALLE